MAGVHIELIIDKVNSLTHGKDLQTQEAVRDGFKNFVKTVYDFTKAEEKQNGSKKSKALSEMIVNDFDEEQIWQQIELQNSECWEELTWEVANCISSKTDLTFPIRFEEVSYEEDVADTNVPDDDDEDDDECLSDDDALSDHDDDQHFEELTESKKILKSKSRPSIVDDKFFKLNDMEKFLINEEKLEEKGKKSVKSDDDDSDSIDLFEDIDNEYSEDEGKEMMYSDFFKEGDDSHLEDENILNKVCSKNGKTIDKKVRFLEPDTARDLDDSDSDNNDKIISQANGISENESKKSEFELRQERLKLKIGKLEEKTLKEAPWQLKGEVDAKKRPENSLLQEVLDFDLTSRPPPIITEQTTITLEGLIKQRVKDKAWDDVVRKDKPVDDQLNFKKAVILDQSKSNMSLAQVYEAEYLKQRQEQSGEVEKEEPEGHKVIREAMTKLFAQLDALTHYHYTPKPPQAEVKIVSNTPAISMEEVAPLATSDAALLAPEEVKRKQKGDLMSKDERSKTDRNRERRKKKKLQKQKGNIAKVTEHRNTKKGVESNDKSLKTSKAFFQQLNDEASSIIKTKNKKRMDN